MSDFQTRLPLQRALAERQYIVATSVQKAVLDPSLEGEDLIVSAQTGSGKTVAYGLALAPDLLAEKETLSAPSAPMVLVVAPTRELALQVAREFEWLYHYTKATVATAVGGMDPKRERMTLAQGAHIVVGTPGRLRDHVERRALDLRQVKAIVLDEADEMLDLGFRDDLEFLLEASPETRRTLLFSATMPKPIAELARRYQKNAKRIAVTATREAHSDIEYQAMRVAPKEIEHVVVNVLRYHESAGAIVFCNTREHVRHLHATLAERGFAAVNLSGELSQSERNHALQALRDGRARVCVATDVAARGIDLPNLNLVIHADLPRDSETLQHRSGRTGRAGKKGISVVLVPLARLRRAERMLEEAGAKAEWMGPPQAEAIYTRDQERLIQDPIFTENIIEDEASMAEALLARYSPTAITAALVKFYRVRLPAAEDVFDPGLGRSFAGPKPPKGRDMGEGRREMGESRRELGESKGYPSSHSRSDEPMTWFVLNIGRTKNASPKWLIPMLCRRGNIKKSDIGSIQLQDDHTRVQIAQSVATAFAKATAEPDADNITISPAGNDPARAKTPRPKPKGAFGSKFAKSSKTEPGQDEKPKARPKKPGRPFTENPAGIKPHRKSPKKSPPK